MSSVVDTDVVSFLFKDNPIGSRYDADLASRILVISFMTLAELDRWAVHAKWGDIRRSRLQAHLSPFVILPYNRALCTKWARSRKPRSQAEIALNARTLGLPPLHCSTIYPWLLIINAITGESPILGSSHTVRNDKRPTSRF